MTPAELKEARAKLGLSTARLAKVLRLGAQGARTVRRWESGENAIPGPAQVAIEQMLERHCDIPHNAPDEKGASYVTERDSDG